MGVGRVKGRFRTEQTAGAPHPVPRCQDPQLGMGGQEMKPDRTESETSQVGQWRRKERGPTSPPHTPGRRVENIPPHTHTPRVLAEDLGVGQRVSPREQSSFPLSPPPHPTPVYFPQELDLLVWGKGTPICSCLQTGEDLSSALSLTYPQHHLPLPQFSL